MNGPGRHAITELTAVPDANGEAGDVQRNFEIPAATRRHGGSAVRPQTTPDHAEVLEAIEATLPADYNLG